MAAGQSDKFSKDTNFFPRSGKYPQTSRAYTLYLEAIDKYIMDSIYKKVKNGTATEFEKDALSNYYEVIHLKQTEYLEYKYKKQQYL